MAFAAGSPGTTAGSTVLVVVAAPVGVGIPAGWERDQQMTNGLGIFHLSNAPAGEGVPGSTPWVFTVVSSTFYTWWVEERDDLAADPLDVLVGPGSATSVANGATKSTGSTALSGGMTTMQLALYSSNVAGSSWSGYTNGFTEVVDLPAGAGGSPPGLAIARNFTDMAVTTYESTATLASSGSALCVAMMLVYRKAESSVVAPLASFTGFEFGTHGGMGQVSGNPLTSPGSASGTWGTTYLVQAGSARNGGFGLRLATSANTGYVRIGGIASAQAAVVGFNVRPVSATGTVVVAYADASGAGDLQLVYDSSTNKFGLRWGAGGTPSWQTGTTPLSTWAWVELRLKLNSSVHHAEWWIETGTGTGHQASPADLTGQSPDTLSSLSPFVLGSGTTAQTATFDYDDVVASRIYGAWLLGPHRVEMLAPETTGATVSGTAANFKRVTNNGTLADVNGTEGALIDDFPPTISASSDAVAQVTTAASDYLQVTFPTPTLAYDEIMAGVRSIDAIGSGAGAGAGDVAIRAHDGLTETALSTVSQLAPGSPTAISATVPMWRSAMYSGGVNGAWTIERIAALVKRFGFSPDATPDMWWLAGGFEIAYGKAKRFVKWRLGESEDPADAYAMVYEYVNTYNNGIRAFEVDNQDASRSVIFRWWTAGTEPAESPKTVTAGNSEVVTVNEDAYGNVTATSFAWAV